MFDSREIKEVMKQVKSDPNGHVNVVVVRES